MSFREQLRQEIAAKCELLANEKLVPNWIAHQICNDHAEGINADSEEGDFWRAGGYQSVRAEVGQYLRKYYSVDRDPTENEKQHTLPGFEFVQTHYIVPREGGDVAIPTADLSDEEIETIIKRHRAAGASLFAHADELERFKNSRVVPPLFGHAAA